MYCTDGLVSNLLQYSTYALIFIIFSWCYLCRIPIWCHSQDTGSEKITLNNFCSKRFPMFQFSRLISFIYILLQLHLNRKSASGDRLEGRFQGNVSQALKTKNMFMIITHTILLLYT